MDKRTRIQVDDTKKQKRDKAIIAIAEAGSEIADIKKRKGDEQERIDRIEKLLAMVIDVMA